MMKPLHKALVVGAVHLALVASLGAKLLYDRSTRPRVWALTAPVDPSLPIRGRYVSLRLLLESPNLHVIAGRQGWEPQAVVLRVENNQLVGEVLPVGTAPKDEMWIVSRPRPGHPNTALLWPPVALFIPEHAQDPSVRPQGEELWVEVTLPKKGPPRPIRLGVKKGDGPITPLELN